MNTAYTNVSQLKTILNYALVRTPLYTVYTLFTSYLRLFFFNSELRAMKNFASLEKEYEV